MQVYIVENADHVYDFVGVRILCTFLHSEPFLRGPLGSMQIIKGKGDGRAYDWIMDAEKKSRLLDR